MSQAWLVVRCQYCSTQVAPLPDPEPLRTSVETGPTFGGKVREDRRAYEG